MSTEATPFESFLIDRAVDFRRISYATKGEATAADLKSEAWIVADEIGRKRGVEIDFADPADRQAILNRLYGNNVSRKDWKLFRAVRIDADVEDDVKWVEKLPAHSGADPLIQLLMREQHVENEEKLMASYSQARAYISALAFFGSCRESLCGHLVISENVLDQRVDRAIATFHVQDSIFDKKARIPKRFCPVAGKKRIAAPAAFTESVVQMSLDFL